MLLYEVFYIDCRIFVSDKKHKAYIYVCLGMPPRRAALVSSRTLFYVLFLGLAHTANSAHAAITSFGCDTAADLKYHQCVDNIHGANACENLADQNYCLPRCYCEHDAAYRMTHENYLLSSKQHNCQEAFSCGAGYSPAVKLDDSGGALDMTQFGCTAAAAAEFQLCSKKAVTPTATNDICEGYAKLFRCFPKCFCDDDDVNYDLMIQYVKNDLKCTKLPPCGSPAPSLGASLFFAWIAGVVSLAGAVNLLSV